MYICYAQFVAQSFFETKFELENVTKRSYVNKQMCEV